MKPTELRIGNWIKRNTQSDGFQIDHHSFWSCERNPENYKPIYLTEDWLEKFGFKTDDIIWVKDEIQIGHYKSGFYLCSGTLLRLSKKIKYVHQLQNLYFALTGKELKL